MSTTPSSPDHDHLPDRDPSARSGPLPDEGPSVAAGEPVVEGAAPRSRFRSFGVVAVSVTLVVAGAWALDQRQADVAGTMQAVEVQPSGTAPRVGEQALDFTTLDAQGQPLTLAEHRGEPVWLTFGASWCSACRAEAPDIQAAYEAARPAGVEVIAVALSEDADAALAYADRTGSTYPQVPDPDSQIAAAYAVPGIPTHFFIDADGVVRSVKVGVLTRDQMDEALAAIS